MELELYDKTATQVTSELQKSMKKKVVDAVHQAAITPPNFSKPKPMSKTYVKVNGKRKKIKGTSEDIVYKKLYDFYFVNVVPTVAQFYDEWIKHRESENATCRTIDRYLNYWDKYYKVHSIATTKLNKIDSTCVENYFHKTIDVFAPTLGEYRNMRVVLSDILRLAKRRGLINQNPFLDADIKTNGCAPPQKEIKEHRIYLKDEIDKMFKVLAEEIIAHPDCTDMYGIMLLFSKGLRLSELPALKLEDVDFEHRQIYIHRMETRIRVDGKNVITVVPYNKQRSPYAIRWLDLTDQEIGIIQKVLEVNQTYGFEDNGYLFVDEKGRSKARAIDERIRKMCRKIGMIEKSAHDIRRTCASNLFHSGMSIEYLQEYLGHSDAKTTRGYIYDVNTKEKNRKLLNHSISQSFNLPC